MNGIRDRGAPLPAEPCLSAARAVCLTGIPEPGNAPREAAAPCGRLVKEGLHRARHCRWMAPQGLQRKETSAC